MYNKAYLSKVMQINKNDKVVSIMDNFQQIIVAKP